MSPEDIHLILSLRLLIARAANQDSLQWWEDSSLTVTGDYLLERIFPVAPALAGRQLALAAARTRHDAACPAGRNILHLYHLDADNRDALALRHFPLLSVAAAEAPITSRQALQTHLHSLLGEPVSSGVVRRLDTGAIEVELPPAPRGVSEITHRARALAWLYLEGDMQQPVFPYCVESTS
jgi:hypothetical protein